jgi:hypothetical protein
MPSQRITLIVGLILVAALVRLFPHPPNVAPIAAMALFAGATFADKRLAFAVPLAPLLLTDLVLGLHITMPFVYAAFAATVWLGGRLGERRTALRLGGTALAASVVFFVVTNFGTWLMQDLYPATAAGLVACYWAAIPFFHLTVAGDLLFTALLFGAWALAQGTASNAPRTA